MACQQPYSGEGQQDWQLYVQSCKTNSSSNVLCCAVRFRSAPHRYNWHVVWSRFAWYRKKLQGCIYTIPCWQALFTLRCLSCIQILNAATKRVTSFRSAKPAGSEYTIYASFCLSVEQKGGIYHNHTRIILTIYTDHLLAQVKQCSLVL